MAILVDWPSPMRMYSPGARPFIGTAMPERVAADGDIAAIDLNAVRGAVGGDVVHTGGADGGVQGIRAGGECH